MKELPQVDGCRGLISSEVSQGYRHSITTSFNQPTEDHNKKFISSQPRKTYTMEGLPKAFQLVLDSTEWSQSGPSP
ncbi:hypothetical protein CEXT_540321 [Caerostris extrusa]|uniref:Uncharacterized protein n=1 Tax=Caerostris extrusa TaxID=172846 RepID=A0AAV4M3W3_CAEEX|nr:hypothetical protein CEXT_540321 [Caerostris extrusa]